MTAPPAVADLALAEDAWARLRRIRDAGRLVADFPQVCALVGALDADHRARAGRLLAGCDLAEVAATHGQIPAVTVAVTGNGTCAPIVAPLVAEFARHRLAARVVGAAHGQYVADLADPRGDLLAARPEVTLCLLDAGVVADELGVGWTADDCARVLDAVLARVTGLARRHDADTTATLVLHTVPLPAWLARQLVDHRSRARLGVAWRQFNAALLGLAVELRRCVVVDLDTCLTDATPLDDPRLRAYAGVGFSEPLLGRLAAEVGHVAKALRGHGRKCLVLDLDGTLWGGVLGDDGPDGIEVGGAGRGAAFRRLQQLVAQWGTQGVLLAVCSKNDPEQVRTVLRDHPDLALRATDLVAVTAGWGPKSEALAELARTLNLGTDSLVLVDDSAFECGEVRHALPEVAVVPLDAEPARHPDRLLAGDWFATLRLTDDDHARRGHYRAEARRQELRDGHETLRDYLHELELRIELARPDERELSRVAQLTQRTNQFHLTTRRMDDAAVREHWRDPDAVLWVIRAADRFGDAGLVGAVFGRHRPSGPLVLTNMLLSCRVFGRDIETAALRAVLADARESGLPGVLGHYRPSPRNGRFADFYPRHGFVPVEPDGDVLRFRHDLTVLPEPVTHLRITTDLAGAS
ncbi:HAD-IIIC family phosphatase [Micromonospora sp. R77]|uniref:HAD-IIIC family phosphatase n=1 Tax=Micromonospora sp. R77 TaxID=2925836 RepID=UPI001F6091BF|nr:HAD-IIIC family phosphatase [Micromonospora sp. R77]MCI4065580.1 HAD-IIIC family phosphatase [Micromonospora sp. R77]